MAIACYTFFIYHFTVSIFIVFDISDLKLSWLDVLITFQIFY